MHHRHSSALFSVVTFVLMNLVTANTLAKSLYVEKWGDNANAALTGCARPAPCASIQLAVNTAGPNDRILVGPGIYLESVLVGVAKRGLKLFSTAGRHATVIRSNAAGYRAMDVRASRVQIGRKGKGFTFIGATIPGEAGLHLLPAEAGSRIKVEGNRFGLPRKVDSPVNDGYANFFGLLAEDADGVQIRNNIFENNEYGGLYCDRCWRSLISDNYAVANGQHNFYFGNYDVESTIRRNVLSSAAFSGLRAEEHYDTKFHQNITEWNGDSGMDIREGRESSIEKNITGFNGGSGILTGSDYSATVKNNLAVGNDFDGIGLSNSVDRKLISNLVVGNGAHGINFYSSFHVDSLRNNSAVDNDGCGMYQDGLAATVDNFKYFAIHNDGGPLCNPAGFNATGPDPAKPVAPSVAATAKIVGG